MVSSEIAVGRLYLVTEYMAGWLELLGQEDQVRVGIFAWNVG